MNAFVLRVCFARGLAIGLHLWMKFVLEAAPLPLLFEPASSQ